MKETKSWFLPKFGAPAQIYIFILYPGPNFTHDQIYLGPKFTHHQIYPRPKFTQHQIYPQPKFTQKFYTTPDLHRPKFTQKPNLHRPQTYTNPILHKSNIYTWTSPLKFVHSWKIVNTVQNRWSPQSVIILSDCAVVC